MVAIGCSAEPVSSQTGAIHVATFDPAVGAPWNAVEQFGFGCSSTIVALDASGTGGVGLTAAHCLGAYAHGCRTEAQIIGGADTFSPILYVSLAGFFDSVDSDIIAKYPIDRIVYNPNAFINLSQCASTDTFNCNNFPPGGPDSGGINFNWADDEALFHFHVAENQFTPTQLGIAPIPVVTSLTRLTPHALQASSIRASAFMPASTRRPTLVRQRRRKPGLPVAV